MSKLLYIEASPRAERSYSRAAADAFAVAYQTTHPADTIAILDIFESELPPLDGATLDAKYAILHGEEHTDEQKKAWNEVEAVIEQFTSADKYLFAVPMWNFGIPYRLKQYLDIILQPGYTFSFSPESGYQGLITDKPVAVVYARGGAYGEGSGIESLDLQKGYMELALGFIGFTDIKSIVLEPTLMGGPNVSASQREKAIDTARAMAADF